MILTSPISPTSFTDVVTVDMSKSSLNGMNAPSALTNMPYQRSSVINEVALSTAPRYIPGPSVGGKG
ncbi:hypothetical protein HanPSC8_Chr03g0116391 [Helianthus annuus]|nr:hypothetical protein HanPSC8_Chr03g0116391 [Helianthus annuus]